MTDAFAGSYPTELVHPRFRVIPRPRSRRLVIFFSGTGVRDNKFHWWNAGQEADANVILVNNGRNEWYQRGIAGLGGSIAETTRCFRAWADALGADRIYTVGASMGGSGALLYGAPLGARVLAFGLETRLDFPWSNVGRLLVRDFAPPVVDLRPVAASAVAPIHIYAGEGEPIDVLSAAYLADLPQVSARMMRRVGHAIPLLLRNTRQLGPLLAAFISDEPLPDLEGTISVDLAFAKALHAAHCSAKERRWEDAARFAGEATGRDPLGAHAWLLRGTARLHVGDYQGASNALAVAIALHPDVPEARFLLASALEKSGRQDEAIAVHAAVLSRWPDFGRSHYALAKIDAARGDHAAAIARLERAIACEPNRAQFRALLDKVRARARKARANPPAVPDAAAAPIDGLAVSANGPEPVA